jgi:cytochrome c
MRRVVLTTAFALGTLPVLAAPVDPKMLDLADKGRCLQCHDIKERISGPAWSEVAKRYRNNPAVFEALVKKVREGGTGAWGTEVMSPNKRVPEDDIRTLVRWILTLD